MVEENGKMDIMNGTAIWDFRLVFSKTTNVPQVPLPSPTCLLPNKWSGQELACLHGENEGHPLIKLCLVGELSS